MPATPPSRVTLTRSLLAVWDVFAWFAAMVAFVGARYDFNLVNLQWKWAIIYACVAAALQLVIGFATKLYRGRHQIGSSDEVVLLTVIVIGIGALLGAYYGFFKPTAPRGSYGFPQGVVMTAPFGALLIMAFGHFVARAFTERNRPGRTVDTPAEPVLIYGAGNAGQQIGRLIHNDPDSAYEVRGFIDDDPGKRNLHLFGTKVQGNGDDLVRVADDLGVKTVILAIGNAEKAWLNKVNRTADDNGLKLLMMPPVNQMVGGQVSLSQLHQIDVADLLGRSQVKTDLSAIAGYLKGKVVLVTGAGGSIGSEIARQVNTFGPKELVMLDRDESGLHGTQLSIYKQGLLETRNMVLCDIRDYDALDQVFADHRPDVVFHAAALKHLPMLELYPFEGWKTNVLGSLNVLKASEKYGVSRYVNISTDKAADPTSVLGKTKRIAEELTAWYAKRNPQANYLSVRFGNVLGSRGSMLHAFTAQIDAGGPVTVTHPDITRFFMTIPEACELVIQAGAIGKPGDVCVLDMGEPVRILDVARNLIRKSGKDIEIVYTGLRPNEKMHEVLFGEIENAEPTSHPKISQVPVPPTDPEVVLAMDGSKVGEMDVINHG